MAGVTNGCTIDDKLCHLARVFLVEEYTPALQRLVGFFLLDVYSAVRFQEALVGAPVDHQTTTFNSEGGKTERHRSAAVVFTSRQVKTITRVPSTQFGSFSAVARSWCT